MKSRTGGVYQEVLAAYPLGSTTDHPVKNGRTTSVVVLKCGHALVLQNARLKDGRTSRGCSVCGEVEAAREKEKKAMPEEKDMADLEDRIERMVAAKLAAALEKFTAPVVVRGNGELPKLDMESGTTIFTTPDGGTK